MPRPLARARVGGGIFSCTRGGAGRLCTWAAPGGKGSAEGDSGATPGETGRGGGNGLVGSFKRTRYGLSTVPYLTQDW